MCGRLIRKGDDRSAIAILEPVLGMPREHVITFLTLSGILFAYVGFEMI
jgi:hypothetical protein